MTYRVCFVCTGNICRSPMAEIVFRERARQEGIEGLVDVDSAGTGGWHEGDPADPRTAAVLVEEGFDGGHTARQFRAERFPGLDLVIALDQGHLRELRALAPSETDRRKVRLLRSYDPALRSVADGVDLDVADPYYGDLDGFRDCLATVTAAVDGLVAEVRTAMEGRAA